MTTVTSAKIEIVIPLYNHGASVRAVAMGALAQQPAVTVVDDGSTDGGAEQLHGLPVRLLSHPGNCGKGAAIMTALRDAAERGVTHLVTLDADGQHDPADLPKFLAAIAANPEAITVGCRDMTGTDVPGSSRFGRSFSNFWLRLQTGWSLGDTQSGYRAYPVAILAQLPLKQTRYAFEVEVLVRAAWAGVPLAEVPVAVYYPPGRERVSHFDKFRDNLRLTVLNTGLTMRSVAPWPHRKIITDRTSGDKISVLRPLRSIRQLLTEHLSPRQLAAAAALGVFLGTLPLIAAHTIAILFAASYLRLNKVAAVSASQLCIPPLVPALCIETGYYLRNGRFLTEFTLETLGRQGLARLYEWLLGSLLLAPLLALAVGAVVYLLALIVRNGMSDDAAR